MSENTIPQEATRISIADGGTAGTALSSQAQLEAPAPGRGDQPGGRLKKIGLKVATVVFDILEQMEW